MLGLMVLALAALATAATMYIPEATLNGDLAWEETDGTWITEDGSPSKPPGPSDDVVLVRSKCAGPDFSNRWSLQLNTDVTVRSVSMPTNAVGCVASLVIGSTGWLRTQSFSAGDGAEVFLDGGNITAPTMLFNGSTLLGGSGTVAGEVVLRGGALLMAGEWRGAKRGAFLTSCVQVM
jgi:hypothetical protein